ncbi:MAG TPA: hypothetical protein VHT03_00930 [Rhizomicrobium sp.]|jgi:hypothetical protein|nr:hypothetical protein [Rhizomicrobium sp.]
MRSSLLMTVAAASLFMAASSAVAGTWVPANPVQGSQSTTVFGINNHNVVTGSYVDSSGHTHGFVGPFDGSNYTSFDDSGGATQPRALNRRGYITGFDTSTLVPWERYPDGTLQNVTKGGSDLNELAQGINLTGDFAGNYFNAKSISKGYIGRKAKFRSKIKIPVPNLGFAGRAIDDAGDVGGWFYDPATGSQRGFVIWKGKFQRIDYPGTNTLYTVVEGMSNQGRVSGQWEDSSGIIHGFIYDILIGKHSYQSLDAPGASFTQVWGINDNGVVAASAAVSGVTQSFVYCFRPTGCPGGSAGHVAKTQHRVSGKAPTPERL